MRARPLQKCSSHRNDVMCAERYTAMQQGEFIWSIHAHGWIFAQGFKPQGPPPFYTFPWCPWCLEPLPVEQPPGQYDAHWESKEE
mgnify:CR=1 FL=1